MKTKIKLSVIGFMLCLLQPASGYQPGFTDSGECTSTTFWRVDALETGGLKLTVYGTGVTHNAHVSAEPEDYLNPYTDYIKDIVEIDVKYGITGIGSGNFAAMLRVRKISLPGSLETIGFCAFERALASDCMTVIPASVTGIGTCAFYNAFINAAVLPESSAEITGEEFASLLGNYQWTDIIPLYFSRIPVHIGSVYGVNPHGIFSHNSADRTPVKFYVQEDLVSLASASSVFRDVDNTVDVIPVGYAGNLSAPVVYDTVYKTVIIEKYVVNFIPVEIQTDIRPYPQETKTPYLEPLTALTYRSTSPYSNETLYFYSVSGKLIDKVVYSGGGTVKTVHYT